MFFLKNVNYYFYNIYSNVYLGLVIDNFKYSSGNTKSRRPFCWAPGGPAPLPQKHDESRGLETILRGSWCPCIPSLGTMCLLDNWFDFTGKCGNEVLTVFTVHFLQFISSIYNRWRQRREILLSLPTLNMA